MHVCCTVLMDSHELTEIHGCLSTSAAVMRLAGLMVSILLIRSFASGVTVSHSGEGNCGCNKYESDTHHFFWHYHQHYMKDAFTDIICASFNLLIESMLVFIPEGWVSNQQDVENHT